MCAIFKAILDRGTAKAPSYFFTIERNAKGVMLARHGGLPLKLKGKALPGPSTVGTYELYD